MNILVIFIGYIYLSYCSDKDLMNLFEEYFDWRLKKYPGWSSIHGFTKYDDLLEDFSAEGIEAKRNECRKFYERAKELKAGSSDYETYRLIFLVRINLIQVVK